jgi:prepilin-type N-terminal cleavage/methylation domain-containing protein
MISEYLRSLKFLAADEKAKKSCETGTLKTKGFTLIELVVACTLLVILSQLATATADNFVLAFKGANYQNQVWKLKFVLTQAQLAYAAATTDPNAISHWNLLVQENDSVDLIPLIAPYFQNPAITDFTSLLQFEKMYDPKGVTNPTIQLGTLTTSGPAGPAWLSSLPMVTWQGISL